METKLKDRVKAEREARGLTQDQLAKMIDKRKGQSFIGNIESGARAGTTFIAEIAHALGVSAYWLKTGKGERTVSGRILSDDEQLLIDAFPHLDAGVREIWLTSARTRLAAIGRQKKVA